MIPAPPLSAITAASLLAWFWALLWATLVFAAIAGYGALTLRAFAFKRPSFTLASLTGFGVTILLGGLLNLTHLIYPAVLIAFTVLGVALTALLIRPVPGCPIRTQHLADGWAGCPIRTQHLADGWAGCPIRTQHLADGWAATNPHAKKLLLLAITLVFAFRIASSVHDCVYQVSDDLNYYLAAPRKMIQTHSFAPDPYSERRVIASVGGNQFLETLILATQPLETTQMADWTLGVFLLALLAFALGHEFELTPLQRYTLAFFLAITPQLRFNLTFVVLPSALFLGLVYLAAHRKLTQQFPAAQAAAIGAAVAAVTSMKSTYITHGAVFLLCIAALRWWKRDAATALRFLLISSTAAILVLLPWMIANHAASGTAMYPILGRGFHYDAYGHYASPSNLALGILIKKVIPFCFPLLVLFAAEFYYGERDERTLTVAALMLTAFLSSILNGIATGGDSVRRYNYPCILPAITLMYIVFARRKTLHPELFQARALEAIAAFLALLTAVNTGTTVFTSEYKANWLCLRASLAPYHITTPAFADEYARMEQALPTDTPALATLDKPFLLDFTQRNILIADFPGTASPHPGWPTWQSADAFADFLLAHNIRYFIYSYGDCHLDPQYPDCAAMLDVQQTKKAADTTITRVIRNESLIGLEARHQYEQLGRTRRHLYDDGHIFILDLTQPAT